jgi:hypothetical protein
LNRCFDLTPTDCLSKLGLFYPPKLKTITVRDFPVKLLQREDLCQLASMIREAIYLAKTAFRYFLLNLLRLRLSSNKRRFIKY